MSPYHAEMPTQNPAGVELNKQNPVNFISRNLLLTFSS